MCFWLTYPFSSKDTTVSICTSWFVLLGAAIALLISIPKSTNQFHIVITGLSRIKTDIFQILLWTLIKSLVRNQFEEYVIKGIALLVFNSNFVTYLRSLRMCCNDVCLRIGPVIEPFRKSWQVLQYLDNCHQGIYQGRPNEVIPPSHIHVLRTSSYCVLKLKRTS